MKKREALTIVCLLFLSLITATAQELKVKSFARLDRDLLARTQERLDLNEEPCAIVRISVPNSNDFIFEGNIIGKPQYTPGEVLIWMTKGSQNVTIKSDKTGSLKFNFPDKLESRVVYQLILSIPEKIQVFRLDFTPIDAKVYINDTLQTALNGSLSLAMNEGQHRYKIEHKFYHTEEGTFEIKKGEATILTKKMKPNFGVAQVSSKRNADITINGQTYKDVQLASDTLLTGTHQIIARQNQIRKKITFQASEGKTERIEVKFRPDIFILGNYAITSEHLVTSLYGATIGVCKNHGGYLSFRTGKKDENYTYKTDSYSHISIGGGYLGRITNWLYLQIGAGYNHMEEKYSYTEIETNITTKDEDKIQTMYAEIGGVFRIGRQFLLSANYVNGFGYSQYSMLNFGVGIAF